MESWKDIYMEIYTYREKKRAEKNSPGQQMGNMLHGFRFVLYKENELKKKRIKVGLQLRGAERESREFSARSELFDGFCLPLFSGKKLRRVPKKNAE